MATKYARSAGKYVKKAVHEYKRGTLTSGRSTKKVQSRKQAIAIGLSEARAKGERRKLGASQGRSSSAARRGRAKLQQQFMRDSVPRVGRQHRP